jgi:hypothetical protein
MPEKKVEKKIVLSLKCNRIVTWMIFIKSIILIVYMSGGQYGY